MSFIHEENLPTLLTNSSQTVAMSSGESGQNSLQSSETGYIDTDLREPAKTSLLQGGFQDLTSFGNRRRLK